MKRASTWVIPTLLLASIALAVFYFATKRSEPAPRSTSPISTTQHEGLVAFVKYETCGPTVCTDVKCQNFSDGQTKALPSHIAVCRWTNLKDAAHPRRCAYVHYAIRPDENLEEFHLSSPASSDACQTDAGFNDSMRARVGYSGPLP